MSNEDKIEVEGIVTQRLPGAMFEVTSTINDVARVFTCSLSGKIRQNKIMISVGDKVKVNVSVYDIRRGIIVWRYS